MHIYNKTMKSLYKQCIRRIDAVVIWTRNQYNKQDWYFYQFEDTVRKKTKLDVFKLQTIYYNYWLSIYSFNNN